MVGKLNDRYHLQDRLTSAVNGSGQTIVNETVSAGAAIFDALGKFLILAVLTVYFLANLPAIRTTGYRLIPPFAPAAGHPHRRSNLREGRCLRPR